jgi:5-methylcytosine-specific restriction endonuclease McrA
VKLNKDGKPRKKRVLSRQKKPKQPKPAPVAKEPKKPSRHIPVATRRLVMDRDGNKCVRCGTMDDLIIHHKLPFGEGGTHDHDNLQVLCMACHKAVHLERGDYYATKMSVSKKELATGERDYHSFMRHLVPDIEGLMADFGLSAEEATTLYRIRRLWFYDGYPSISGIANDMNIDELELATRMLVLREKGLLFTTQVPDRQNCYTLAKGKLADYFAVKIVYYDAQFKPFRVSGSDVPQSTLAREADIPVRIITSKEV